jgi:hypothetical protein
MKSSVRLVALLCLMRLAAVAEAQTCNPNIPASTPTTDFVDHGDGTVTHTRTGLMWKRCVEARVWNGATCTGTAGGLSWVGALKRAVMASTAGYTDWRLPNIKELESIVEDQCTGPSVNATIFPNTPASSFWSASSVASYSRSAWYVNFNGGDAYNYLKSNGHLVRLVRTGESFAAFDSSNPAPQCSLSASPSRVRRGQSSVLTTICVPAATSWTWTGGSCAGTTAASCTVSPSTTTAYGVTGTNNFGSSTAEATVRVTTSIAPILNILLD